MIVKKRFADAACKIFTITIIKINRDWSIKFIKIDVLLLVVLAYLGAILFSKHWKVLSLLGLR